MAVVLVSANPSTAVSAWCSMAVKGLIILSNPPSLWDVMGGVARRAWARNENSITTSMEFNKKYQGKGHITLPYLVDDQLVDGLVGQALAEK